MLRETLNLFDRLGWLIVFLIILGFAENVPAWAQWALATASVLAIVATGMNILHRIKR